MSDYFDRIERELREAVRRRAHMPWYRRLRPWPSRPLVVALACLVATGTALAATGALRTGRPVGATVLTPHANNGVALPRTVRLLPLRVADPAGGPPWGLRVLKTTRGLMCAQLGRVVDGRLGVLGQDGAFGNDGAFHPLSPNAATGGGFGCGTEDAHGHAFVNEALHGLPASGLSPGAAGDSSSGCYAVRPARRHCPPSERRDIYYGLLGPDATAVKFTSATGATATEATAGGDGAYLIVLPHSTSRCGGRSAFCPGAQDDTGSTGGPELEASEVIRVIDYKGAPSCHLPTPAQAASIEASGYAAFRAALRARFPGIWRAAYRDGRFVPHALRRLTHRQLLAIESVRRPYLRRAWARCPVVGYAAPRVHRLTHAQLATPITVRAVPARRYCEEKGWPTPCDARVPAGARVIGNGTHQPPLLLLLVQFRSRVAVRNFDSHYEINISNPSDPGRRECPPGGGASFGPTNTDLRAGQLVRHPTFVNPRCPGRIRITVGFVTVDGPSGSMPVPGLPGQSGEIPVGETTFVVP